MNNTSCMNDVEKNKDAQGTDSQIKEHCCTGVGLGWFILGLKKGI